MSFSYYRQLDTMDCGSTCLRMIIKHYGREYSPELLRKRCHNTREGVSLLGISDAAESLGLHTVGVKLTWQQLIHEANLPCIVHWNQNHFIVVYEIKNYKDKTFVYVADPAEGLLKYPEDLFKKNWLSVMDKQGEKNYGIALLLEPTPLFYEQKDEKKNNKFNIGHLIKYLKPHGRNIIQVFLAMIVASLLSLILPFITQSMVDKGINIGNLSFVKVMLTAQIVIIVGQLANELIRNWLMLHMTARVGISLISDFLAKMMRLPISFFDTKMTGDIMQRIQDHNRIQDFLTNSMLSIAMSVILLFVYGSILGGYNLKILVIFLTGSMAYVGWVLLFLHWRKKLDYMRFQEAANNQSNIVQLIGGMQDIKLNNCEKQKRWEWERIQAKLFRISIKGLSLSQAQQTGGVFIDQAKNIVISYLAAKLVIDGHMTLGMMMSLQYIIGQLNAPVSQFISFVRECQDANISMERLGEIHNKKDEEAEDQRRIAKINIDSDIEFNNVIFQYEGPRSPKVLDGITFKVPHNKVTAIVGTSGSGKTTILKIMLGFYRPTEGVVTLGGIDLKEYSESQWRKKCGCTMQDSFIFSNSIAENIALCDEIPDMDKVRMAADIANIREWIEDLPLGYNTKIGMDGHGLSTGQKQRILIARAAYKNSPYLFFDEATNSLDSSNEKVIMDNLDRLFKNKTVVIVAHRLSTVKNADNIIVLANGKIVEEGPHCELIAKCGYYYKLVRNQLELGN